jgi:uncharacterized damage-inducible protein DinB
MTPDFIKAISGVLIQGIRSEVPTTKKCLAAIPDKNHDYRPDEKSKTAMELGWHIASSDVWFIDSILNKSFANPPAAKPDDITTGPQIAEWYEAKVTEGLAKLETLSAEHMATPIDFYGMVNLPAAFYLNFLNNHSIHHRGQLSTYYRPMGGKCPSIYGGSADEPMGA